MHVVSGTVVNLQDAPKESSKSCRNCMHSFGFFENLECIRVGRLCREEMNIGGKCCNATGTLKLWHPRTEPIQKPKLSFWQKLKERLFW